MDGTTTAIMLVLLYASFKMIFRRPKLVFDLDETLVTSRRLSKPPLLGVRTDDGRNASLKWMQRKRSIWIRPHTIWVLYILYIFADLYLFTSAKRKHADTVCDEFLPNVFKKRFYIRSCITVGEWFKKSLRTVVGTDTSVLKRSILIDDKPRYRCDDQNFYKIPAYNPCRPRDYSMIVLLIKLSVAYWTVGFHVLSPRRQPK